MKVCIIQALLNSTSETGVYVLPAGWAARWLCKVSGEHSVQGCCHPHFQSWSSAPQTYLPVLWSRPLFCLYRELKKQQKTFHSLQTIAHTLTQWNKETLINSSSYLLFEIESLGGALAKPLTPAVREGSELALLVWAPSLPQVLGLRLAKKDLGDWVLVGLLAVEKTNQKKKKHQKGKLVRLSIKCYFTSGCV